MKKWERLIKTLEMHEINEEIATRLFMEFMVNQLESLEDDNDTCLNWSGLCWDQEQVTDFYYDLMKSKSTIEGESL